MRCVNPRQFSYRDLMGARRFFECPCGKCVACLHNYQDSWSIRCLEETKANPTFVYDTLTFRPSALPMVALSDILDANQDIEVSEQSAYMLAFYNKSLDDIKSINIPYVTRDIIRSWFRRGRELYAFHHNGERPNWKYLIVQEYGPKTSRPHFHCLIWGASKSDYKRYLGKPWYRLYGATKPSYFNGNSTQKDRECITRYISKYCSKGVFESPWVKDGLVPKPFKCVSQGLGLAYLDNPIFDYFKGILPMIFKDMTVDEFFKTGQLERTRHARDLVSLDIMEGHSVPEKALKALSVYFDALGRPHALPRYYKMKLLNTFHPNVFHYTVQNLLLARADVQYNKDLQAFARSLGVPISDRQASRPHLGIRKSLYNLLADKFVLVERVKARIEAKRRYIKLTNHYLRPARGVDRFDYGVSSSFLALVC